MAEGGRLGEMALFKMTIRPLKPSEPPTRADQRWVQPTGTWFCEAKNRAEAKTLFDANLPVAAGDDLVVTIGPVKGSR